MGTFEELKQLQQQVADAAADVDTAEDQLLNAYTAVEIGRDQLDAALDVNRAAVKKLTVASVALNRWTPPVVDPPTPPSTIAGFNLGRFLHEQDTRYNVADQAKNWEFQVIQGDVWKLPMVQQLRAADPAATLLRVTTSLARRRNDTNGYTTALPPGEISDSWMLRNTSGQILERVRDGDQLPDPGNIAYQTAIANRLEKLLKDQPYWTGVWLDEMIGNPQWWNAINYGNGIMVKSNGVRYTTQGQWQAALQQLVNYLRTRLSLIGKQVWVNLAFDYTDVAWGQSMVNSSDGSTNEFFVARGNEQTAVLENAHYSDTVDWMSKLNASGKLYHAHAQTDSASLADYAAGVFALFANPDKGFFSAGKDPYPVAGTMNSPMMQVLRRTGAPKGPAIAGQRLFEKGTVRVNASSQASATLPATTAVWVAS